MECATDIRLYYNLLQEDRIYGLNDRFDNIHSDMLQMRPFPSV